MAAAHPGARPGSARPCRSGSRWPPTARPTRRSSPAPTRALYEVKRPSAATASASRPTPDLHSPPAGALPRPTSAFREAWVAGSSGYAPLGLFVVAYGPLTAPRETGASASPPSMPEVRRRGHGDQSQSGTTSSNARGSTVTCSSPPLPDLAVDVELGARPAASTATTRPRARTTSRSLRDRPVAAFPTLAARVRRATRRAGRFHVEHAVVGLRLGRRRSRRRRRR